MALITTTRGDIDDSLLLKTEYLAADTDDDHIVWTEYCDPSCPGEAHKTGRPETKTMFCTRHLHHSVHVTKKRIPESLSTILGAIG